MTNRIHRSATAQQAYNPSQQSQTRGSQSRASHGTIALRSSFLVSCLFRPESDHTTKDYISEVKKVSHYAAQRAGQRRLSEFAEAIRQMPLVICGYPREGFRHCSSRGEHKRRTAKRLRAPAYFGTRAWRKNSSP